MYSIVSKCPAPTRWVAVASSFWISHLASSRVQNCPDHFSIILVTSPLPQQIFQQSTEMCPKPAGHSASCASHNFPAWHQSAQLRPWGAWRRGCRESWKSWPDWSRLWPFPMVFWFPNSRRPCTTKTNHQKKELPKTIKREKLI